MHVTRAETYMVECQMNTGGPSRHGKVVELLGEGTQLVLDKHSGDERPRKVEDDVVRDVPIVLVILDVQCQDEQMRWRRGLRTLWRAAHDCMP